MIFLLFFTGEVTPGLSQTEYSLRRHKLMAQIQQEVPGMDHTVILLSNPTYYMSNDIPYTFHQDTNFLYLCGFQEPDSILVLQSLPGRALPSHKAMLFVPRRDPSRELWDGPRSGTDGAVALTGVDEGYTIEEFRHLVAKLKGKTKERRDMKWHAIWQGLSAVDHRSEVLISTSVVAISSLFSHQIYEKRCIVNIASAPLPMW